MGIRGHALGGPSEAAGARLSRSLSQTEKVAGEPCPLALRDGPLAPPPDPSSRESRRSRRRNGIASKVVALILILSLGLCDSTFALRTPATSQSSGLEELTAAFTGLEEVERIETLEIRLGEYLQELQEEGIPPAEGKEEQLFNLFSEWLPGRIRVAMGQEGTGVAVRYFPDTPEEPQALEQLGIGLRPLIGIREMVSALDPERYPVHLIHQMTFDGTRLQIPVPSGVSFPGFEGVEKLSVLPAEGFGLRSFPKGMQGLLGRLQDGQAKALARQDLWQDLLREAGNFLKKKELKIEELWRVALGLQDPEGRREFVQFLQIQEGADRILLEEEAAEVKRLLAERRQEQEKRKASQQLAAQRQEQVASLSGQLEKELSFVRVELESRLNKLAQAYADYLDPAAVESLRQRIIQLQARPAVEAVWNPGKPSDEVREQARERLQREQEKLDRAVEALLGLPLPSPLLRHSIEALVRRFSEILVVVPSEAGSDTHQSFEQALVDFTEWVFSDPAVQRNGWSPARAAQFLERFQALRERMRARLPEFPWFWGVTFYPNQGGDWWMKLTYLSPDQALLFINPLHPKWDAQHLIEFSDYILLREYGVLLLEDDPKARALRGPVQIPAAFEKQEKGLKRLDWLKNWQLRMKVSGFQKLEELFSKPQGLVDHPRLIVPGWQEEGLPRDAVFQAVVGQTMLLLMGDPVALLAQPEDPKVVGGLLYAVGNELERVGRAHPQQERLERVLVDHLKKSKRAGADSALPGSLSFQELAAPERKGIDRLWSDDFNHLVLLAGYRALLETLQDDRRLPLLDRIHELERDVLQDIRLFQELFSQTGAPLLGLPWEQIHRVLLTRFSNFVQGVHLRLPAGTTQPPLSGPGEPTAGLEEAGVHAGTVRVFVPVARLSEGVAFLVQVGLPIPPWIEVRRFARDLTEAEGEFLIDPPEKRVLALVHPQAIVETPAEWDRFFRDYDVRGVAIDPESLARSSRDQLAAFLIALSVLQEVGLLRQEVAVRVDQELDGYAVYLDA